MRSLAEQFPYAKKGNVGSVLGWCNGLVFTTMVEENQFYPEARVLN
jgi:hypothetical protein